MIKVRIFLDKHVTAFKNRDELNRAAFKLFAYDGKRNIYPNDSIRNCPYSEREVI